MCWVYVCAPLGLVRPLWPLPSAIWFMLSSSSSLWSPDSTETCWASSTSATTHTHSVNATERRVLNLQQLLTDKAKQLLECRKSTKTLIVMVTGHHMSWHQYGRNIRQTLDCDDYLQAGFTVLSGWAAQNRFELQMCNVHSVVRIKQRSSVQRDCGEKRACLLWTDCRDVITGIWVDLPELTWQLVKPWGEKWWNENWMLDSWATLCWMTLWKCQEWREQHSNALKAAHR